jgi:NAD(P)H dehydrogenase (quinone)
VRVAVTGAAGKTGRHVVSALTGAGHEVRALARDADGADRLRAAAEVEVVTGDQTVAGDLLRLLEGCGVVCHIPPNLHPDEVGMARAVVTAARTTGTRRVVYHSVLHPQCETMPHHWDKARVESLLLASGLETVFLQPAPYVQNLHPYLEAARRGEPAVFPYGSVAPLSMVDLVDVGAAVAVVVDGDEHAGGAYQLCSSDRLTPAEAWARAAEAVGVDPTYRSVSPARWRATTGADLPDVVGDRLERMFDHYDRYGLVGSPRPLADLLGRSAVTLDEHLAR